MSDGGSTAADSRLFDRCSSNLAAATRPTTSPSSVESDGSAAIESSISLKDKFSAKLEQFLSSNLDNKRSSVMSDQRYRELIAETKEAKLKKLQGQALTAKQHRRFKRFDVLSTTTSASNNGTEGGICIKVERLIDRNSITSGDNVKFFCPAGELYEIIHSTHISMGHKREKSMEMELKRKYCNVTRVLIKMYLELCPRCQLKKEFRPPRVKKPAQLAHCNSWDSNPQLSSGRDSDSSGYSSISELNYRCQVDLVDMQMEPDGEYRFILNYHDFLTKFVILRPLKTKTPEEVTYHLIDVFCLFGAPCILHSEHGREFCNRVIKNLSNWSNIKVVNGKPRSNCQKQLIQSSTSSSECTNQEVRDNLITWMANEKTTKWSEGLKFVQSSMNRSFNRAIRRSPFEAMFGTPQRNGLLDTYLPKNIVQELQTEEDLEEALVSQGMTVQQLLPDGAQQLLLAGSALKEKEADNNQEQPSVLCVVCQKETATSSARVSSCFVCKHPVHATCGTHNQDEDDDVDQGFNGNAGSASGRQIVCFLCLRKKNVDVERKGCKRSLELDATGSDLPLVNSKKSFNPSSQDQSLTTSTLGNHQDPIDRGRLVPRNFVASSAGAGASSMVDAGLFIQPITTTTSSADAGYFDCFYARNDFQTADTNFMQMEQDVNHVAVAAAGSNSNSIKTQANLQTTTSPTTSSNAFVIRCNCRIHCNDKKCSCRKNNVKCNVKCHGSAGCANK